MKGISLWQPWASAVALGSKRIESMLPADIHRRLAATALPVRVRLKRARGWRMPPNTVKVDRSTKWGNPFKVGMLGVPDAAAAVARFERAIARADLHTDDARFLFAPDRLQAFLGGRNLACWCALDQPCHADVLLRLANGAR